MQEKLASTKSKLFHLSMVDEDDVYRASPYEFAETADSCLELISASPSINVGHSITIRSPLSEIAPNSILVHTDSK